MPVHFDILRSDFAMGFLGFAVYELTRVYHAITDTNAKARIFKPGLGKLYAVVLPAFAVASGAVASAFGPSQAWQGIWVGFSLPAGLGAILPQGFGGQPTPMPSTGKRIEGLRVSRRSMIQTLLRMTADHVRG